MPETPPKPPTDWNRIGRSPYLVIGVVFLAVGVVFITNESMRTMAFAFLPLGFVFFILAMTGAGTAKDATADDPNDPPSDPDEPDAPPAPTDRT